jgi:nitroreductase
MDIVEAFTVRRSIRAYKPDPVSKSVLSEIMEQALRSPSWANTQPWEFAIATGTKLEEIRKRFAEKEGTEITPDFRQAFDFPEPYDSRCRTAVEKSHAVAGIKRENKQQRKEWEILQLTNFGAPCEIYIYIDKGLCFQKGEVNVWPVYDCGAIGNSIMLLAPNYKLGTIAQARATVYPDIIREVLGIPDSKLMLLGIAIGYPDWDHPLNQYPVDREPLDKLVSWYGFE